MLVNNKDLLYRPLKKKFFLILNSWSRMKGVQIVQPKKKTKFPSAYHKYSPDQMFEPHAMRNLEMNSPIRNWPIWFLVGVLVDGFGSCVVWCPAIPLMGQASRMILPDNMDRKGWGQEGEKRRVHHSTEALVLVGDMRQGWRGKGGGCAQPRNPPAGPKM